MNLSVQLYSARKFSPFEAQLKIAADNGYAHVETFGPLNDNPAASAKLFASYGLTALSAHIPLDIVVSETSRAIDIAGALGGFLDVPVASIAADQAKAHVDWLGMFFGADAPASSARTRELLGWTPTHPTLLEDIAAGHYPGA